LFSPTQRFSGFEPVHGLLPPPQKVVHQHCVDVTDVQTVVDSVIIHVTLQMMKYVTVNLLEVFSVTLLAS